MKQTLREKTASRPGGEAMRFLEHGALWTEPPGSKELDYLGPNQCGHGKNENDRTFLSWLCHVFLH